MHLRCGRKYEAAIMGIERGQRFCDLVRQINGDKQSLILHARRREAPLGSVACQFSVIPSASEGPRQHALITQAKADIDSALVRSLTVFAVRDDDATCKSDLKE